MERESLFVTGSEMNRMSALDNMNERRRLFIEPEMLLCNTPLLCVEHLLICPMPYIEHPSYHPHLRVEVGWGSDMPYVEHPSYHHPPRGYSYYMF